MKPPKMPQKGTPHTPFLLDLSLMECANTHITSQHLHPMATVPRRIGGSPLLPNVAPLVLISENQNIEDIGQLP